MKANRSGVAALVWAVAVAAYIRTSAASFPQLLHKTIDGSTGFTTNSVFSPYSVSTALAMLRQASTGESQREIVNVIGRNYLPPLQGNVDSPGVALRLFNGFFYDSNLKVYPDYIHYMKSQFRASVEEQPFVRSPSAARQAINSRVERETLGKIQDLIPPSTDLLVAVLVSAIYMKAEWQTAFDLSLSGPGHFTRADGVRQTVHMMNAEAQYNFLSNEKLTAIALPYKDERFQMVLVLPGRNVSTADVVSTLDLSALYKDMWFQNVKLKLPKFRIETKVELSDVLKKLGIRAVFSRRASLQGMSPDRRLFVSQVQHSAVIETDERGSEAAAATGVAISARSFWPTERTSFIADRPFLFYIYDVSTGGVLFSGHVADAAAAQGTPQSPAAAPATSPAPGLVERQRPAQTRPRPRPPPPHDTPITFPESQPPVARTSDSRFPLEGQFPPRARPSSNREARNEGRFSGGQQLDARRRKMDVLSWDRQRTGPGVDSDPYTRYSGQTEAHSPQTDRARGPGRFRGGQPRFSGGQPVQFGAITEAQPPWPYEDRLPWWQQ